MTKNVTKKILSSVLTASVVLSAGVLNVLADRPDDITPALTIGESAPLYEQQIEDRVDTGNAVTVTKADGSQQSYADLIDALANAEKGSVITLNESVNLTRASSSAASDYSLWIEQSITLDGQGHTIDTSKFSRGIGIAGLQDARIDVTLKNVTIVNSADSGRCVSTREGVSSLTMEGVNLQTSGSGNNQTFTVGGSNEMSTINIRNSSLSAGAAGYAVITFNPVQMTIDNSKLSGYAALYMKGPSSSLGSSGSVVRVQNGSELSSKNPYPAESQSDFGTVVFETDNIQLQVVDSKIITETTNSSNQEAIGFFTNYETGNPVEGNQVTISGSSKVENIGANTIFVDSTQAGTGKNNSIQISGGSFNFPISPEYCAPGFKIQQNADGSVVVVPDGSTTPPAQNNGSSGSTTSSTVASMEEAERPDPQNEKAQKAYEFWMQVKAKIRAAKDGKTLTITVPQEIENMPASVMQTLYEKQTVTLTLRWSEKSISIPAGQAMEKQPMRVYWTQAKLTELYND